MALADLASPAAKMHTALKDLQVAWATATEKWNDSNSRHFEEQFLQPLAMTVKISINAVGRMDERIQRAEHACSDQRFAE